MFGNSNCTVPLVAGMNGGGFGGNAIEDIIALVIVAAIFGWGRGGGVFGGGGGNGCDGACATVGDIQRGFNQQSNDQQFAGLTSGLSQLGYADLQQFSNVLSAISTLGFNVQNCCCDTQRAIDGVNYNMANGFSQLGYQQQQCCCDLQNTMNSNTQTILNQLNAYRMEDKNETIAELRSQVQALNLAQSQANQNNLLLGRLQPTPVPSYTVASPYATYAGCGCCGSQFC